MGEYDKELGIEITVTKLLIIKGKSDFINDPGYYNVTLDKMHWGHSCQKCSHETSGKPKLREIL